MVEDLFDVVEHASEEGDNAQEELKIGASPQQAVRLRVRAGPEHAHPHLSLVPVVCDDVEGGWEQEGYAVDADRANELEDDVDRRDHARAEDHQAVVENSGGVVIGIFHVLVAQLLFLGGCLLRARVLGVLVDRVSRLREVDRLIEGLPERLGLSHDGDLVSNGDASFSQRASRELVAFFHLRRDHVELQRLTQNGLMRGEVGHFRLAVMLRLVPSR